MNEWIGRLKSNLNPGVYIMLILGVVLLLVSCRMDGDVKKNSSGLSGMGQTAAENISPNDDTELVSYYEDKLADMLSEVKGLGRVKIMLSPNLDGACILCEGAGDVNVKREIIDICESLFEIPAHKVQILEIKKENGYEEQ